MRTVFQEFFFCDLTGGKGLDVCLGKKCASYAMSKCIGDDSDDDTFVVEMSHCAYVLGLFRIRCDADAGIRERLTEIYLQRPPRRDCHTTGDDVYFTLLERGYQLLKFVNHKGGIDAHVGCDFLGDLDLEPNQFARFRLDCPRNKFCDSNTDRSSFKNIVEHIRICYLRQCQDK
jgi:hypothetical protein